MQPADNSLEDAWTSEGSSLEAPTGVSFASDTSKQSSRRLTPTRVKGMAFGLTGAALILIIFIGVGALLFSSHKSPKDNSVQTAANYAVSSITDS